MIKEYKNIFLGLAIIIAILFLVLIVSGVIGIFNKIKEGYYIGAEVAYKNTISVEGEGKVYTKPDIALVNLSVVTEGREVKDVQEENTEKMNGVIDYLKEFGIEDKDIKTIRYQISPRYSYEQGRIPKIIGYEINQTLEVKVRETDEIGKILEGSVDVGINQVNSLSFKVDDEEPFKEEARKLAIEDAKEKSKKLASQLGVKLIKISGYNEGTSLDYSIYRELGIGGGAETPQIEVGENEIVVNVVLIYEIN